MNHKRSEQRAEMIRNAWAARCMGLIFPGVHIDDVPKHCRDMVRAARRDWIMYRTQRALRMADGPMLSH